MYYLNDKHSKYEYTIYVRYGTAVPYFIKMFNSYSDAYRFLEEKAKRHNHFNQIYYVDVPFFKNDYEYNTRGFYYKILRRPVADWQEFEEKKVA